MVDTYIQTYNWMNQRFAFDPLADDFFLHSIPNAPRPGGVHPWLANSQVAWADPTNPANIDVSAVRWDTIF